MIIDKDVHETAKLFGLDERLIQAVVNSEGDIVKAVQCSVPSVHSRGEALMILCRSCAHMMTDYIRATGPEAFIDAWAQRWAPEGAANDPHGLNAHWGPNVKAIWLGPPKVAA